MSNLKIIPITKEMVHVIMTHQPPEYLFPILLKYFNSNVSSEVFDEFLARIIILCAIYNNSKVLEYIIRWGGDPDTPLSAVSRTRDNRTALNVARERGSE